MFERLIRCTGLRPHLAAILCLIASLNPISAQTPSPPTPPPYSAPATTLAFDHAHRLYAVVLDRFVKNGLVDYTALKSNPRDLLTYLNQLAAVTEGQYQRWSKSEQLAYGINLYNAATLKLIVDNYPLKSIKNIGYLPQAPWRLECLTWFGKPISLGHLEHDIIRVQHAEEPGSHFALVCAAMGCPVLRSEPYVASRLKAQLEDQARAFLSDTAKNRVIAVRRTVLLSPIFRWYEEDFTKVSGSVLKYIAPYLPADAANDLRHGGEGMRIEYSEYNWDLNDVKNAKKK